MCFFSNLKANSGDTYQRLRSVVSDLGLHCLPMSHKKEAELFYMGCGLILVIKALIITYWQNGAYAGS